MYPKNRLFIQVTKSKEMNVYLYGGKDRLSATVSLVNGNTPVEIGYSYNARISTGMLLIAYPNQD